MAEAEEEFVVIGRIVGAHGVRGELKLRPDIDDTEFLGEVDHLFIEGRRGRTQYELKHVRSHKSAVLLTLEGVDDRTAAEGFRNRNVAVPLSWLPDLEEDEFYVAEIVGLTVEDDAGDVLGTIQEVIFTGANEVYVVDHGPHGQFLLPAIASVVQAVDLERGVVTVQLPPGLLE